MPVGEDDGNCVTAGLPASLGAVRRKGGSRRSFWVQRQGEGWPVATATANSGDEPVRVCCGERTEEEGERGRVKERARGVRGVLSGVGEAAEAGGGRRWPRACRRTAGTRPASSWQELGDDWRRPGGLGRPATVLGRLVAPGKWPTGLLSLSLSSFILCSIFAILF